jgi:hypothetical protein
MCTTYFWGNTQRECSYSNDWRAKAITSWSNSRFRKCLLFGDLSNWYWMTLSTAWLCMFYPLFVILVTFTLLFVKSHISHNFRSYSSKVTSVIMFSAVRQKSHQSQFSLLFVKSHISHNFICYSSKVTSVILYLCYSSKVTSVIIFSAIRQSHISHNLFLLFVKSHISHNFLCYSSKVTSVIIFSAIRQKSHQSSVPCNS